MRPTTNSTAPMMRAILAGAKRTWMRWPIQTPIHATGSRIATAVQSRCEASSPPRAKPAIPPMSPRKKLGREGATGDAGLGAFSERLGLVGVEGLRPSEAAIVCGVSPEALRQRLKRARELLAADPVTV